MIKFVRVSSISAGKQMDAGGWAKEMAALIQSLTGQPVEVSLPVSGNPYRICWTAQFETLAGFEQMMAKLMMSQAYHAMIEQAATLFVEGSVIDELWKTV